MSFLLQLDQWQTSIIFLVNETEEDLKEFIRKNPKKILLKEAQELVEALKDALIDGQVNSFEKGGYYCMIKDPYKEVC